MATIAETLRSHGIKPTPQRIDVARIVMTRAEHLTAEQIFEATRSANSTISRATVYNTLNLMAEHGLVIPRVLEDRVTVYDTLLEPHHHLIDEITGEIVDIPWKRLQVNGLEELENYEVNDFQVVIRGRRRDDSTDT